MESGGIGREEEQLEEAGMEEAPEDGAVLGSRERLVVEEESGVRRLDVVNFIFEVVVGCCSNGCRVVWFTELPIS